MPASPTNRPRTRHAANSATPQSSPKTAARSGDVKRGTRVVVLSYPLWLRAFGGARGAIGKTLDIDGKPHEVIGVMPRDFFFPAPEAQLWRPLTLDPFWDRQRVRRYTDWWIGVGRLRSGVSVAKAQEEMNGIGRQLEREYRTGDLDFAGFGVNVVSML